MSSAFRLEFCIEMKHLNATNGANHPAAALARGVLCAALGVALCAGMTPLLPRQSTAAADTVAETEQRVKDSASAYNSAVSRQKELAGQISELNSKISALEKELPQQKKNSDESCRALYKYQSDTSSVVMMLLDSSSITDMLALLDQYNWVIEYNTATVKKTQDMESELKDSRDKLVSSKQEADEAASTALSTLKEAQAARKEAQEAAIAAQKAEEEAQAKAAKEEEQKATTAKAKKAAKKKAAAVKTTAKQSNASTVGWSQSKTAFVNKWAARINSYLSGSPTAGTGKYYAEAAWDNGVDPRWAPAISCIESGKGAHCFRSHNAWGYGGINFSSWQEGINTVVAKLGSSTYGGYLTREAAATYCASDPSGWYSNVAAQMANI